MNRLHIYLLGAAATAFVLLTSFFGFYTLTFVEAFFFIASIMMVFSFEKLPKENLDKPQISSYRSNRLNLHNYLSALNVAFSISLYLILKYILPHLAGVFILISWMLGGIVFHYIYIDSIGRRQRDLLKTYLLYINSSNQLPFVLLDNDIERFVELFYQYANRGFDKIQQSSNIEVKKLELLYSISIEFFSISEDAITSHEIP